MFSSESFCGIPRISEIFLNLDDGFRLLEFLMQFAILPFEFGNLLGQGVDWLRLAAPFLGCQACQRPFFELAAPGLNVGVVKTFTA